MSKDTRPNYPDILGQITDQHRVQFGAIEAALALKPATPHAGEIFEAVVLLQNTTDQRAQVTATPRLPTQDASGKAGRFAMQRNTIKFTLMPGEVGYMSLPLRTAPDTTPGNNYKMSVDIAVDCDGRPNAIRQTDEPATPAYYSFVKQEAQAEIDALKELQFSTAKSGLLHKDLEITFSVLSGSNSEDTVQAKPKWHRLWTLFHNTDLRPLVERHQKTLIAHILPKLTREHLYEPLYQATRRRFAKGGYTLQPDEAHYITKLLMHVLDLANRPSQSLDYPGLELYEVGTMFAKNRLPKKQPISLPGWCRAILARLDMDSSVALNPIQALASVLYDDLLQDGVLHGFGLIHETIGHMLGDYDDAVAYSQRFIKTLHDENANLTFEDVYLPLVLGGIIVDSHVVLPNEKPGHRLYEMTEYLQQHRPPGGTDTQRILIHSVCRKVCDTSLEQFSSWS